MWVCAAAAGQRLHEKHEMDNGTLYSIYFFAHFVTSFILYSKHETLCTTWRYLSRSNKSDRGARRLDSNSVKIKVWKVIWILNDPKREKSLLKNIITLPEEFSLFFHLRLCHRKKINNKINQAQSRYIIYIIL